MTGYLIIEIYNVIYYILQRMTVLSTTRTYIPHFHLTRRNYFNILNREVNFHLKIHQTLVVTLVNLSL